MGGVLYIVATPIGNSEDITLRALDVLKNSDYIACEDTRVTSRLLAIFNIQKPLLSFHEHSGEMRMRDILRELEAGKKVALVTDAGTPGISDPGNKLVEYVTKVLPEAAVVPVPGVSAVIAALSVAGFSTDRFLFLGFPPHKNKRQKFFKEVSASQHTTVFYESSHRIKKCLIELQSVLPGERKVVVCREITKKFESVYRGNIAEIAAMDIPEKGEFVVVVGS